MASDSSVKQLKLAVLIDADNAQSSLIRALLAEVARYRTVCVKRAYGEWTGTSLESWKEELLKHAIQPIQQFAYTHGKNSTDSAMIIEAMDLSYSNRFGDFCLVSSDSDFTRLAVRVRESGLVVYGFGVRRTPQSFVTFCSKFIYVENLVSNKVHTPRTGEIVVAQKQSSITQVSKDCRVVAQLQAAVEAVSNDDRWAELGKVCQLFTHRHLHFDSRNYGYSKFSDLITATLLTRC
jgi:uncharacterized LabA/DUF88 family protein